ncbi:hypothetical protein [Endozoicomonas sp. SCSIO W0465]|uniref:hypothetical protein n=1 Tax=Endozoicomonas sp. SCSIO W0465 TaxID=2918516 RepID=UPI002074FFDE|nr:hypothetical protein [Endozoicomonas sp. SCSIO W0465]USE38391.1 hypothetical protein MJO57_09605 [Endozoicomonas sp. SCSIO W0465]
MTFRAVIFIAFTTFFLVTSAKASKTNAALSLENIIQQEIDLNEMLINIHRLQLDFLDQAAREALQEAQQALNISVHSMPKQTTDLETDELLTTFIALWPVINKHITWLSTIPVGAEAPPANSLLRALAKMDRQLILLRQKAASAQSEASQELRFLEQALLMQHITRDYLSLMIAEQSTELTMVSQKQLKALADRFGRRMTAFNNELSDHPHAMVPVQQAHAAWSFIHSRFEKFPEQQTPDLVVRYGNRIVRKLSSVHRMF